MDNPADSPTFTVEHTTSPDSDVLLGGFTEYGLAGLTAVDYLVDQLELDQTGHVTTDGLPTITPFEDGTPRHPIRLFSDESLSITVLVGELFVPRPVARSFSDTLLSWTKANGVDEIAVPSGVPVPHAPDDHRVFYVATDDYRRRRLEDTDFPPMRSGFLDGVNGSLVGRGIDSPLAVGVYVTPVHSQAPDLEAAIRLVECIRDVYDLDIDIEPLEAFTEDLKQYYSDLADRIEMQRAESMPDDRMYM